MSKKFIPKPAKSVVEIDYSTTTPSEFDENCIKGYKQISIWNRGRKASQGHELQKDWFNHYTRAILKAQEILEFKKIENEGVNLTHEEIQERIQKAQWTYMKEVEIPKGYKSKCKKITISSMKYTKPRIPNKPDIDTWSTYTQPTIKTPKRHPAFVSKFVETEMRKLDKESAKIQEKRDQLIQKEKAEVERLATPIHMRKDTQKPQDNVEIEKLKIGMSLIQKQLDLIVNHMTKDKPKKTLRFKK